jgi:hypothetical protein
MTITAAVPAAADETYLLDKDFPRYHSHIVIHLIQVNVTDKYMGNIYPSKAPRDTKWAHLVYQYENTGDQMEVGNIQYELIDNKGRIYKFNPNQDEYSGVEVRPHSKSDIRWNEIPIPEDAVLAKVHVFQGTNPNLLLANETYDLQLVGTITPTPTPASSATATRGPGCFSPLLPFVIIGSLAIVGICTRGRGVKK